MGYLTADEWDALLDGVEANARRGVPPWVTDAPRVVGDLTVAYRDDTDSYDIGLRAPCGVTLAKVRGVKRVGFMAALDTLRAAQMEPA